MKIKKIGNLVVAMAMLLSPMSYAHEGHHHDEALSTAEPATDSVFNLKSEWTDQNGRKISLSALQGQPVFIAMIYTSCESACPLIVEDMKKIEQLIPEGERSQMHFALFSFDSERDTSAKLKQYAKTRRLSSNWILAHGTSKSVRALAATLGVQYRQSSSGDFQHSNLITLLNQGGVIKKQQTGLGNKGDDMARAAMAMIKKTAG